MLQQMSESRTLEHHDAQRVRRLGRRAFLKDGALLLAGSAFLSRERLLAADDAKPTLRLGLITDLHHADKEAKGKRYYRESLTKLAEAAQRFRDDKVEVVVELGDLIDSAPKLDAEKGYLRRMVKEFSTLPGEHHYVVGNHCVRNLTKADYLQIVGRERTYYSFDAKGYHFVVLDACFCSDGRPHGGLPIRWPDASVPREELQWLREDLRRTPHKTLIFVHQCLDVGLPIGVSNAHEVRKVLEESGKVLASIQGHYHYGNYQELGHIHYCTMTAVVEGSGPLNNSYAVMDLLPDDVIRFTGFRKQKSYTFG